jgi:hypothetical protein
MKKSTQNTKDLSACECTAWGCPCMAEGTPATVELDGAYLCDACVVYSLGPDEQVMCSRVQNGVTCSDCDARIEWGPIQTDGGNHHQEGSCQCDGREWYTRERGSDWSHPSYREELAS